MPRDEHPAPSGGEMGDETRRALEERAGARRHDAGARHELAGDFDKRRPSLGGGVGRYARAGRKTPAMTPAA